VRSLQARPLIGEKARRLVIIVRTGPAQTARTVTVPVLGLTATMLGGVFFSSTAVTYSSSGLAKDSDHSFFCFSGAALYAASALCRAPPLGTVFSGLIT